MGQFEMNNRAAALENKKQQFLSTMRGRYILAFKRLRKNGIWHLVGRYSTMENAWSVFSGIKSYKGCIYQLFDYNWIPLDAEEVMRIIEEEREAQREPD